MAEYVLRATKTQARAGSFYDRIERFYDLTFKVNGYGKSLDEYLERNPLPVTENARILDAGCGTGTLTLALLRALKVPVKLTAIDLSSSVIATARKYVNKNNPNQQEVRFAQGNVLALPFADESFDLIVTSGVLEYVPLEDGFTELARVIAPGGYFLHLPMRPSVATRVLELLFRFKVHPPEEVADTTDRHFKVVSHYRFPPFQIIGWSKSAVLARKI
jgi:ubiquinone/menaquinone biosynthesis C-methylase UbiE